MFDFFGAVPPEHVQHHRVGADRVEFRGVEDPFAQDRGVVLDCRDERDPLEQPAVLSSHAPPRPVAQQLANSQVIWSVNGVTSTLLAAKYSCTPVCA